MDNSLKIKISEIKDGLINISGSTGLERNSMLDQVKKALIDKKSEIFSANQEDLERAKKNNVNTPLVKRLVFNEEKLSSVCDGIDKLIELDDPVGKVLSRRLLDEKLLLEKVAFPIGVICMIFEARPDALVQISCLCLKSGNSILLKGGSDAISTNRILVKIIKETLETSEIGSKWIQLLETHQDVEDILKMEKDIDLIIPRGSNKFVRYIMDNTKIPVIGHSDGLCTIYIDYNADVNLANQICYDSKTNYPAACNSVETILVNKEIASSFLPVFAKNTDILIYGDKNVKKIIDCEEAGEKAFDTEYLDKKVAIKIVKDLDEALKHIQNHSSHHTEAIITADNKNKLRFAKEVDSADVFINCSTRFADGFRFGLGAEVGISTGKIHCRGPVGLEGLMTSKWLLQGCGQTVSSYSQGKKFIHEELPTKGESYILKEN